jgi:hypothetical protein
MERIASDTITTIVEPMSSSLVDHDTLPISSLTSLKKPIILFAMTTVTYRFLCLTPYLYILIVCQYGIKVAGAGGIEPPVTVLETVGLPLTDAPKTRTPALQQDFLPLFHLFMRRMLLAKLAKLAPLQLVRILLLVLGRIVIPILTYSAFKGDSFLCH